MSLTHDIGNEMDILVEQLGSNQSDASIAWSTVKKLEKENKDLLNQLFCYAEDFKKLLAERNQSIVNESEKIAAYKQLERFNKDFMLLMAQKEKSYKALESSHLDTIRRLATAAEFKDDDTGVHIIRMSRFSAMIAKAYGEDIHYCNLIEQASPMHDIGKIGVPDSVLKKPGKLTDSEWECMRKHPEYGANILGGSTVPVLQLAEQIALSHHEKFDGSGYPFGLKGEQIPLGGRIVALADYFDALTMDRCYRPAFSDEKAISMIKENIGIHFDPKVVEAFLSVSSEIITERDRINTQAL
ncbi:HD domain-containing protein [Vibrio sp. TH_r3]|uniref:HD-GYP domain-containing protein n=1 Tax=Vibrio sp. TH_r3 TaxID=3082084 RepID=UPI0029553F4A|nr:HD domain-containing phosphohydrolase [Vibrio sp. TH_r3]MDV7105572.1 HD domain-containing protein [Vibrio sp. TH_r3]